VLDIIDEIDSLETLNLDGTKVGWLAKRGAKARLRRRQDD
jgi:hypothetical protein